MTPNELCEAHVRLVRKLAWELVDRIPPWTLDIDDAIGIGMVALVEASRRFDPARGVEFGAYARQRVAGAMLDELRRIDDLARSQRGRIKKLDDARADLEQAGGRLTEQDIADAAGLTVAEAREARRLNHESRQPIRLDGWINDGDDAPEWPIASLEPLPGDELIAREESDALQAAIDALPVRLRYVIDGWYLQEREQTQVAAELDLTPSRISQLAREGVEALRELVA